MSFNFPENEIKQVKIFSKLHDNSPVTVVFIHGFASNHVGFNRMGEILDQHKISYFTFDLPGHGETPVIEHTKMHINYFTKIVEDIIKYYKLKNIVLVGHSMGGGIASLVLPDISLQIKKLILIDPLNRTIYNQTPELIKAITKALQNKTIALEQLFFRNNESYKKKYSNEYQDVVSKPLQVFLKNKSNCTKLGLSLCSPIVLNNIDKNIKNFLKPIALFMGENDLVFDKDRTIHWINDLNGQVETFVIKDSGHAPFLEQCKNFADYFLKLLNIKNNNHE